MRKRVSIFELVMETEDSVDSSSPAVSPLHPTHTFSVLIGGVAGSYLTREVDSSLHPSVVLYLFLCTSKRTCRCWKYSTIQNCFVITYSFVTSRHPAQAKCSFSFRSLISTTRILTAGSVLNFSMVIKMYPTSDWEF